MFPNMGSKVSFLIEKKNWTIQIILDIENSLWKSDFGSLLDQK